MDKMDVYVALEFSNGVYSVILKFTNEQGTTAFTMPRQDAIELAEALNRVANGISKEEQN